ncbi:nuclear transport factor 2 family protein [Streptomyces phaeochromogenes]|uniref:nuclear transport factor 2 family protein n=1 Tax=Streptomyces phaeochromogenes TaxID=1923 RepID=UPI0036A7A7D7
MSIHTSVTEAEAADRLALRELVEAYAHCADRRDAKGQMALFTEDTHFVVCGETYCLAHHPTEADDGSRTMMVASIRYLDTMVKREGKRLFAERRLLVNWTDTRPTQP